MKILKMGVPLIAVAVMVAAFVHYYNPFTPPNVDRVLSEEFRKMQSASIPIGESIAGLNEAQVMRKYENRWRDIEIKMRQTGASDAEIRGVLESARKNTCFSDGGHFTYAVPVKARRVWVRFKPVWIMQFRWGCGYDKTQGGIVEPPSHIKAIAIQGRKPFRMLGMETCS